MKLIQKQIGETVVGKLNNQRNGGDMKNQTIRTMQSKLGAIVVTACLTLGFGSMAQAVVITLTGGDPGEGYAPLSNTVYAYHFTRSIEPNAGTSYTVQGVTFQPFVIDANQPGNTRTIGNVTATAIGYPAYAPAFVLPTANDTALTGLASGMVYGVTASVPTPLTLTLGGLVSGNTYQLDLFWQWNGPGAAGPFPTTYTITGANSPIVESFSFVKGTYYDVRDSVVANALGQISVVATNSGSPDVPYLGAFSLTIPEPSTMMLLGVGALLVVIKRRRVHT